MRGHSNTALATRSPNNLGPSPDAATRPAEPAAAEWPGPALARLSRRAGRALGLLGALSLAACGTGYGDYTYVGPQQDGVGYSGRLAVSWMLNGTPLTTERCQAERIDWMAVQIVSERDGQSSVEFLNVDCALSRYSLTMVPSGPVRVYINAVRVQKNKTECVRYAAIAHTTAGSSFPQNPTTINLLAVNSCP